MDCVVGCSESYACQTIKVVWLNHQGGLIRWCFHSVQSVCVKAKKLGFESVYLYGRFWSLSEESAEQTAFFL